MPEETPEPAKPRSLKAAPGPGGVYVSANVIRPAFVATVC